MKHVKSVTKSMPAQANIIDEIGGMIKDFIDSVAEFFNK